jgi:predicted metallo-beta-lactamase superfamily hydrolase
LDIIPLAAESLGTRAMCLLIRTVDQVILFDPSVSLGPRRYGLPPHIDEIGSAYLSRQLILDVVTYAKIIIQSHYHGDHFTLGEHRPYEFTNNLIFQKVYGHRDKIILAKDNNTNINYNQKKRAHSLWKQSEIQIHSADNKTFRFGQTRIIFSPPLPHGPVQGSWVVSVIISDPTSKILITSDVNGPSSNEALEFILSYDVDIIILDGPSTYHPKQTSQQNFDAFERINRIVDLDSSLIIDHHFLRDINWKSILTELGILNKIETLANLVNLPPMCLESLRKKLHEDNPLPLDYQNKFISGNPAILKEIQSLSKKLPQRRLSHLIRELSW